MADLEALKLKRDQLNAKIQREEARMKATSKKDDDRVKVLVGAAVLESLKHTGALPAGGVSALLTLMDAFLVRPNERNAVLGESLNGSNSLRRLLGVVTD